MSLATLKKKSNRGVISGKGKDGFSIVGGYRNKGRVGETYENQYVRTLYKGIDAVGHGGNNSNYVITEIKPKITTNNYKIIKKPNLTTKGYIYYQDMNVQHLLIAQRYVVMVSVHQNG